MTTQDRRISPSRIGTHATLMAISVVMAAPLLWMVVTSLMTTQQLLGPFPQLIPNPLTFASYETVFRLVPLSDWLWNSAKIAGLVTVGTLVTSSLAGYAFARLTFPGRNVLFLLFIATMMVPFVARVVPLFLLMRDLGWINTHWAIIIPSLASPLSLFLFRQYYLTLPRELEDAATIDGAGSLGIYRHIFAPLSGPVAAAVAMITFVSAWNEFFWALLMLSSQDQLTVTVGVSQMRNQLAQGLLRMDLNLLMAASLVSIAPVLVVFLVGQRWFVKGVSGIRE